MSSCINLHALALASSLAFLLNVRSGEIPIKIHSAKEKFVSVYGGVTGDGVRILGGMELTFSFENASDAGSYQIRLPLTELPENAVSLRCDVEGDPVQLSFALNDADNAGHYYKNTGSSPTEPHRECVFELIKKPGRRTKDEATPALPTNPVRARITLQAAEGVAAGKIVIRNLRIETD
jgi:hypothetical protein